MLDRSHISALILAGGQGLRMGGMDKGLLGLEQQPLIEHVLQRIHPQVDHILISANRNQSDYRRYGFPVLTDRLADYQGPLSGISEGLRQSTTPWLLVVPCDSPQLPTDLAERLAQAVTATSRLAAIAHDGRYLQPAFSLVHRSLLSSLELYLDGGGRKLGHWLQLQQPAIVDFGDQPDSFINLNAPEQLQAFKFQPR
ncbi:MAG: molybdopterin-guanine dinucleotide biosynthesis protein A [Motiliproteus sp.]|jgi:molybdopterin-guanine dinucleotide biosynthesis protein A